jgi:hypothetical protein
MLGMQLELTEAEHTIGGFSMDRIGRDLGAPCANPPRHGRASVAALIAAEGRTQSRLLLASLLLHREFPS